MTTRLRLLAGLLACALAFPATAQEIRVGLFFAIKRGEWENDALRESVAVVEHLFKEASESGLLPSGMTLVPVLQDSGCDEGIQAGKVVALAERLVAEEAVSAIIEAGCRHVGRILSEIAAPNAIPLISLENHLDNPVPADLEGTYLRIAARDEIRQGQQLARILLERGLRSVAILEERSFTSGRKADAFAPEFKAGGGAVTMIRRPESNLHSIASELSGLSSVGGDALVIISNEEKAVLQAFESAEVREAFGVFGLIGSVEPALIASAQGAAPRPVLSLMPSGQEVEFAPGTAADLSSRMKRNFYGDQRQAHDAAALLILALAKAGSVEGIGAVIQEIANAPGERILAGDLKRGLEIIAAGGEIDFVGATGFELLPDGNPAGNYDEMELRGGEFVTIRRLPQD